MSLTDLLEQEKAIVEILVAQTDTSAAIYDRYLTRLNSINTILGVYGSSGGSVPTQRTPSLIAYTNSGTIAAGSQSVDITNTGGAAATVLGTSLGAGLTVSFRANGNDTVGAITYNATGTTLLVARLV